MDFVKVLHLCPCTGMFVLLECALFYKVAGMGGIKQVNLEDV